MHAKFYRLALMTILATALSLHAQTNSIEAARLFAELNSRYDTLKSLAYTVSRSASSDKQSVEEKWDFKFAPPGSIKIEYFTPGHRIAVINDSALWEYIPKAKRALKTDFSGKSNQAKAQTVAAFMAHVAVEGLRVGDFTALLPRITRVTHQADNLCIIEGQAPKFIFHVDTARSCLIRSELYDDKGDLMLLTEASHFIQAAPGFWIPQNINATHRTKQGMIKSQTVLSNIQANKPLDESLFQFTPPKGIKVMEN